MKLIWFSAGRYFSELNIRAHKFKIFDKIKLEYFRSLRHFETEQAEESHLRGGDIHGIDSDIVHLDHSPGTGMRQHKLTSG